MITTAISNFTPFVIKGVYKIPSKEMKKKPVQDSIQRPTYCEPTLLTNRATQKFIKHSKNKTYRSKEIFIVYFERIELSQSPIL